MLNSDIKNLFLGQQEAKKAYLGEILFYEKIIDYSTKIWGKWTDDSTEEDWYYWKYNRYDSYLRDKISLVEYTNPDTKEFIFDMSEIEQPSQMFRNNTALEYIYSFATKDTWGTTYNGYNYFTGLEYTFAGCSNLKQVTFGESADFSNLKICRNAFLNCTSLVEVTDLSKINNPYSIDSMFSGCTSLQSVTWNNFTYDIRFTERISMLFWNCAEIKKYTVENFNMSGVTECDFIFRSAALTDIVGSVSGINFNLYIQISPLTRSSIMVLLNGLMEQSGTTKVLQLNPTSYDTLSQEDLAIATSKGWTVSRYES